MAFGISPISSPTSVSASRRTFPACAGVSSRSCTPKDAPGWRDLTDPEKFDDRSWKCDVRSGGELPSHVMTMPTFEKTTGWRDWCAAPTKPQFRVPAGSVDAHCHVFGPGDQFPFAPERKYTPCDASKEQLFALRDFLGFEKNGIVQATCHGKDNRALVDALRASNNRARGVATVARDVTDADLREMHEAGIRGTRFN